MDKSEILKQVNEVFIDVLSDDNIVLNYQTSAVDIEDWNSLNHIHLIVAVEEKFGIRFKSREIEDWNTVGELVDSISNKLNAV